MHARSQGISHLRSAYSPCKGGITAQQGQGINRLRLHNEVVIINCIKEHTIVAMLFEVVDLIPNMKGGVISLSRVMWQQAALDAVWEKAVERITLQQALTGKGKALIDGIADIRQRWRNSSEIALELLL